MSLKLPASGARVVVNYCNSKDQGERTLEEITGKGGSAILVKGDMTNAADVDRLVEQTRSTYGGAIDILINVVGGLVARKTLSEMDEQYFEHVIRLNLTRAC